MRFDGNGAATDMRNDGNQVVVDVSNATIPENLRKRLDVTDFATPVVSVEPRSNAGGSRLVVNTNGAYESMCRTSLNVTGDLATAVVVSHQAGEHQEELAVLDRPEAGGGPG